MKQNPYNYKLKKTYTMSSLSNVNIDWSSPNVLEQIVQNINGPLQKIMNANQDHSFNNPKNLEKIIFSSSKEISEIIEEIMMKSRAKSLSLTFQENPEIFEIYETNQNVREMCTGSINPQKMAKIDKDWLLDLEKEIHSSITQNDLNLYDLSFKMAVSERQLHRKISNLIFMTPNKYIRVLRLHKAKKMIDSYIDRSISQIAYKVGYNDVNYFSKIFIEQYDISPKEMINALR
jgi:AraC-like DNA-binding protein